MTDLEIQKMVALAVRAKVKINTVKRGWSLISQEEIIALAFIADLFLEDYQPVKIQVAQTSSPNVISEL